MMAEKFEEISFQRIDSDFPSAYEFSTGKFRKATYNGVDVAVKEYPLRDRSLFQSAHDALQEWKDEIGSLVKSYVRRSFNYYT